VEVNNRPTKFVAGADIPKALKFCIDAGDDEAARRYVDSLFPNGNVPVNIKTARIPTAHISTENPCG
jgi:hypothetical protein